MAKFDPKVFSRILVAVDDSDDAQLAFRFAMNRAKNDDAELVIVSVLEPGQFSIYQVMTPDFIHGKRANLEVHLQHYLNVAERFGIVKARAIIAEGKPGEVIVKQVIPQVDPDLLVIGSVAKKGATKYFGSQAAYMAKYAPTSIMIIR